MASYTSALHQILRNLFEHRQANAASFIAKYDIFRLVWFEEHEDILAAIAREKALKEWQRVWKIRLIEAENPEWNDLASDWPI